MMPPFLHETLTFEVDDRLTVLTINRPEVRNALSQQAARS
jgi:enoyl-CoA hydratase/carnithine racemase